MVTSDDEDDVVAVVGSRLTDSNMAAVSVLALICDKKSDSIGWVSEYKYVDKRLNDP